jgi:TolA-binding protein
LIKREKERVEKEKIRVQQEKVQARKNQILVKDGVSYREVTVQKGDTVYRISRRYSKEGASYLETLKFNNIDDPDQISSGDSIKVPLFRDKKEQKTPQPKQVKLPKPSEAVVPKQQSVVQPTEKQITSETPIRKEAPITAKKPDAGLMVFPHTQPLKSTTPPPPKHPAEQSVPTVQPATSTEKPRPFSNNSTVGQKLFEKAIGAYRSGDCQTAVVLFNRYLAENASSLLAADASLLIADCYLKLSGK